MRLADAERETGIVEQDVDVLERRRQTGQGRGDRFGRADIHLPCQYPAVAQRGELLQPVGAPARGDDPPAAVEDAGGREPRRSRTWRR